MLYKGLLKIPPSNQQKKKKKFISTDWSSILIGPITIQPQFQVFFIVFFFSAHAFATLCRAWFGDRWWLWCWWWCEAVERVFLFLDSLDFSWIASMPSNASTTSFIEGRFLGSGSKHFRVSCAACNDAFCEYWPSILASIMLFNFLLLPRLGLTHSTRFCCPVGRFVSSARMPVSISSSTTPKPYTSLFTYKWPVE